MLKGASEFGRLARTESLGRQQEQDVQRLLKARVNIPSSGMWSENLDHVEVAGL